MEAEPLYLRALAIRKQELGPEHPDMASSLNNLALLYQMQGRYAEAESRFQQALRILEQQQRTSRSERSRESSYEGVCWVNGDAGSLSMWKGIRQPRQSVHTNQGA